MGIIIKKILLLSSLLLILSGCKSNHNSQPDETLSSTVTMSTGDKFTSKNYKKTLKYLENITEKTDKDIFFKRGVCYYHLDNYHLSLQNFKKDIEMNGEKNNLEYTYYYEKMSIVFDLDDQDVIEKIIPLVIKKEERDGMVIKIYTSNNWKKRQKWFGYFELKEGATFIVYDSEREQLIELAESKFSKMFDEMFFASYKDTIPLWAENDPDTYSR